MYNEADVHVHQSGRGDHQRAENVEVPAGDAVGILAC